MATRTVRLDDEADRVLAELQQLTGLSVSAALKRGLEAARAEARHRDVPPYAIYRGIDLGPDGYARASARRAKSAVRAAIGKKHGR